jgi:cation diffusion facilitator family transporter
VVAGAERARVLAGHATGSATPRSTLDTVTLIPAAPARYAAVTAVLARVLGLNLLVAVAKIAYGYATGAISITSDGFHSLTDSASNVVAMVGVRAAGRPPDMDHPYGHRKYETLAAAAIVVFLLLVLAEIVRTAASHVIAAAAPTVDAVSFAVMIGTLVVNLLVVRYERAAAARLASEVLLADALHTRSDVLTSVTVLIALGGVKLGVPLLDPLAALVVAVFIGRSGYEIARDASRILSDRIVIAADDIREVVMQVPGVLGCHHIRTRGSSDHVFLDLHVWMNPATRLVDAHALSHVVKDRIMARYPQIADAIIHIEPPPPEAGEPS